MNKPTDIALFAVLEACVAAFAFTTLSLMFDLGYRLEPLVFEKDLFGIPGWFTVVVLKQRTAIAGAILLASALRLTFALRFAEGAKRWFAWILLAGAELMAFTLWFFVVGSAVLSAAPL